MSADNIRQEIRRKMTPELYRRIRRLWIAHSIAEDGRDIPGLLATLSQDCVYEMVQTGHQWHGHEGARRFYTEMLNAFPDIHFDLQNIVIGPQGVWEEAAVTGTHQADWLHLAATGEAVSFTVLIFFPWNQDAALFAGERIYLFGLDDRMLTTEREG